MQSYSPLPNRRRSPHIPPHSQYIHPLSCVPTGIDLPIYTSHSQFIPPYSPRPNLDLPTYASKILTTLFSCPKRVDLPTYIPSPFTIHTASFSCPKRVDLPTYTSPTHNTYNLFLVSQPASISPHTFCLSSSPSLLTLCVGVGFAALFVIFGQCDLWWETSVKCALCVQCQPTVSAICEVILLRDSDNHRCEL